MKILHLLASPVFSGPAEVVAQLAFAQRTQGHDVTVALLAALIGEQRARPSH